MQKAVPGGPGIKKEALPPFLFSVIRLIQQLFQHTLRLV